ncbi:CTP synthase [Fomitiporia mediterranea MF3/22]|uniref:CTP synthase n=1 Tax=Fomitiporia mediterranea (strain MF3/22) TaxID=694068 RepID=UPI0004408C36|nr:CTP synthase [Fomitiporia mediterranea MF3/22]EJD05500.1 CTP synthase [Fomitiporia mediterranea MF3/22]
MTKYILVSGGVVSGIGKGVIASSTGLLLKMAGLKVTAIKIDPYMNIDAGTMAPTEHGEVYVLNDGGEVDLDLGNYERYLDVTLTRDNNITTGKIYKEVIERERKGDYLGKTVQIVPHVTNAIQDWIERVSKIPSDNTGEEPDVCIIELGGTVGDIESAPFIEAMRQFQFRVGHANFALIHVSMVPDMHGEQKTKPTQTTVHQLRGLGLLPDIIACRLIVPSPLQPATKQKIGMFCHVGEDQVIGVHDVSSLYHVPLLLESQGIVTFLRKRLELPPIDQLPKAMMERGLSLSKRWKELTRGQERLFDSVSIALVGKYTVLKDSYMSVIKALEHSAFRCNRKLEIKWVESSDLEPETQESNPVNYHDAWRAVVGANGILVPGGFGQRGTEGMIQAVKWAREQRIPFLGICLGFQVAVIEWARNVLGMPAGNSGEFSTEDESSVVIFMPEGSRTHMGGTMRLGLRPTVFSPDNVHSKVRALYGGAEKIWERHRHRYEVSPQYVKRLEESGMRFAGKDEKGERMQIMELGDHPYFVGLQAHPEFCSRPLNPSPPFLGFVASSCGPSELADQCELQRQTFVPPHPPGAMVDEAEIIRKQGREGDLVNAGAPIAGEKVANVIPNGA